MKKSVKIIFLFILIQSVILIMYQYLQDTLLINVPSSLRFLLFLIATFVLMLFAMSYVKKAREIQLNYFKSFIILAIIFFPTPFISRIFWGVVYNNIGKVNWLESLLGILVIGIALSIIVSIFFRKEKQA